MFHHRVDDEVTKRVFVKWYLLSFLAGNINAGGFFAAASFVTHVTGFGTLIGVEIAGLRWDRALGLAAVPAFFLLGTMISAYLIDYRYHRDLQPHYDWVMGLETACLIAVAAGGYFNLFGAFGEEVRLKKDFFFLALLCLSSGLQNAAITTASGATVRTTHLTGITTDLGIGIVRVLSWRGSFKSLKHEIRANWLRVGTIVSFMLGSAAGAALFDHFKYLGFLIPAAIAFYATIQARRESHLD